MASGVAVNEKCVETYKTMVKDRKIRCAVFKINEDSTEVQLEQTYSPVDGSAKEAWDEFKQTLPDSDCRYVAYDFNYEHQGAIKNRIVFLLWSPDSSKIRSKMLYASSQDGVVNSFEGVQRQIQCNDPDEIEYEAIAKKLQAHSTSY